MAPQPVPYGLAVDWGQGRLFGLSMERCLRLSDDGVASVRPIKGTRPRGSSARADAEASAALLGSDKERAENTMIVDMVRNDLRRIAPV